MRRTILLVAVVAALATAIAVPTLAGRSSESEDSEAATVAPQASSSTATTVDEEPKRSTTTTTVDEEPKRSTTTTTVHEEPKRSTTTTTMTVDEEPESSTTTSTMTVDEEPESSTTTSTMTVDEEPRSSTTTTTQALPPTQGRCGGRYVDYMIELPVGLRFVYTAQVTYTAYGLDIPAGRYLVSLASQESGHPAGYEQYNEQWRANFGSGDVSGFSADLADSQGATNVWSSGGLVTIGETSSVTAEHWSVANASGPEDWNSVDPICIGLTEVLPSSG